MRNTWTTMQYQDTRVLIDGDTFVDCGEFPELPR